MKRIVLTVDDSKTIREMLGFTLKTSGFEVMEAEDGQVALDLLANNAPDLIITDLNMPNMDGLTFIKTVRGIAKFQATPILMLTTEYSDEKKAQGRAAGATGWIVKPFAPDKLIDVVNKVCL